MDLGSLSKRALSAIKSARLETIDYFAHDLAAERLLAVVGCGRRTIREIANALERTTGKRLGGLDRVMSGLDMKPVLTTLQAAKLLGVDIDAFLALVASRESVKRRGDNPMWSAWDLFSVRRMLWSREAEHRR